MRGAETIGRTLVSPAISGKDFVRTEGILIFEPGQRTTVLDVILTPETGSLNPFPKRFQIMLFDAKGGAGVDKVYGTANITLVSDADSQAFWGLADQLQQPLDGDILNRVLQSISAKVATENTDEQLSAVLHLIDKVRSPCECWQFHTCFKRPKPHAVIISVIMNLYGRVEFLNLRVEFTVSDHMLLLGWDWCWFGSSKRDEFSTAAVRTDWCLKRGFRGQKLQALSDTSGNCMGIF